MSFLVFGCFHFVTNLKYQNNIVSVTLGTSDEHLSAVQYLTSAGLRGALVVTTPQEVALLDVRKELQFCAKLGVPVIGVLENMSLFVCPNCKVWRTG